jgi:hypothetical protein
MKKLTFSIILLLFTIISIQAQKFEVKTKDNEQKIYIKAKDSIKLTIYVDGKIFDFPIDLIDQNRIESVSVLKGHESSKKYNEPNGVILIKTKISEEIVVSGFKSKPDKEIIVTGYKSMSNTDNKPLIIIDGKTVTQEVLEKLNPNDFESMSVVKGEKALKEYNAPNGVIIITTKKM